MRPNFRRNADQDRESPVPFDCPHYDESGEPPYLEEWMEARTGIDVVGLTCVSLNLLSDSLKLYFQALQHRVIGFTFSGTDQDLKDLGKPDFIEVYKPAVGEILQTDWTDCPVDFGVIEQVVLARNRAQHGSDLTSLTHDPHTLKKYPRPFFASDEELETCVEKGSQPNYFFTPAIEITRQNLFEAIAQTEALADWIDSLGDRMWTWRTAVGHRR